MKTKLFLASVVVFFVLMSTYVFASVADGIREPLSPLVRWGIIGAVVFDLSLFVAVWCAHLFIKSPHDNGK